MYQFEQPAGAECRQPGNLLAKYEPRCLSVRAMPAMATTMRAQPTQSNPKRNGLHFNYERNLPGHQSGVRDRARIREPRGHSRSLQPGRLPLPSEEGLDRRLGSIAEPALCVRSRRQPAGYVLRSLFSDSRERADGTSMCFLMTSCGSVCGRRIFCFLGFSCQPVTQTRTTTNTAVALRCKRRFSRR